MNNVETNSSAAEWWEYILAFNPDLITQESDLWERFPGIADGAANGRFVGQHLEAARILKKTNQGKVIIAGGPGSGKTSFGILIAQAVVEGGVVDTLPTPIPSAASLTWVELERRLNEQTNVLRKALVVWTAPQNAQVLDATIRLHKAIPGGIIIKVHTWKAEVAALLDAEVRTPKVIEPGPNATATERTIARLLNTFYTKEFNKHSPAADPYSISSQLRARAMADPEANRLMFEVWEMRVNDPVVFETNCSEITARFTRIMKDFVRSANVLVGTPVAIKILFDHLSSRSEALRPDLIINDEAGRSTEAMSLVPLAKFPETPTLWLGDGKQLGPMTPAAFDSVDKPLFQDQRGMSLLKRAQETGNADFTF
ncbi:uncharacterized protein TrAtP1_003867 [Trichoderma atroviride]|nr:hypothetical protein TrAtP1_003867 [Trichoderma atroviride]